MKLLQPQRRREVCIVNVTASPSPWRCMMYLFCGIISHLTLPYKYGEPASQLVPPQNEHYPDAERLSHTISPDPQSTPHLAHRPQPTPSDGGVHMGKTKVTATRSPPAAAIKRGSLTDDGHHHHLSPPCCDQAANKCRYRRKRKSPETRATAE